MGLVLFLYLPPRPPPRRRTPPHPPPPPYPSPRPHPTPASLAHRFPSPPEGSPMPLNRAGSGLSSRYPVKCWFMTSFVRRLIIFVLHFSSQLEPFQINSKLIDLTFSKITRWTPAIVFRFKRSESSVDVCAHELWETRLSRHMMRSWAY